MRDFLKDLNIVGMVGVWQEGETLRYTFDNLLKYCNYIAVLMDRPNKETEEFVLNYKEKYPDIFRIRYSEVPVLRDKKHVRRRTKVYASQLGEEKLAIVKQIHGEHPVDILLALDSDEVYTDSLPQLLEEFWKSDKTSVNARPINVYDEVNIIINKGMASHFRIYKYIELIHYSRGDTEIFFIHMQRKNQ